MVESSSEQPLSLNPINRSMLNSVCERLNLTEEQRGELTSFAIRREQILNMEVIGYKHPEIESALDELIRAQAELRNNGLDPIVIKAMGAYDSLAEEAKYENES